MKGGGGGEGEREKERALVLPRCDGTREEPGTLTQGRLFFFKKRVCLLLSHRGKKESIRRGHSALSGCRLIDCQTPALPHF